VSINLQPLRGCSVASDRKTSSSVMGRRLKSQDSEMSLLSPVSLLSLSLQSFCFVYQ